MAPPRGGGAVLPMKVESKGGALPFGLPEKGAPELLALLTFIAGFTLISDAIVGVAFGGTIFYWTCVGAAGGYAGVLLGFLTGLPLVFATAERQADLLPSDADSHFCLTGPGPIKKLGKLLTLLYLTMDACLAGGVLGAALAGGLGLILELWYAPQEGEFYAERDIHQCVRWPRPLDFWPTSPRLARTRRLPDYSSPCIPARTAHMPPLLTRS